MGLLGLEAAPVEAMVETMLAAATARARQWDRAVLEVVRRRGWAWAGTRVARCTGWR